MSNEKEKVNLPHHEQKSLCTTRLPYRQGRKLTAVKAYSITKESNHLLIFGVPSLNLRQEVKALFIKFGRLLQFNVSLEHPADTFTDTYHAQYDRIQPARQAKRMLDMKNFYGGSLHICYAPELESIEETRQKILQRQRDVLFRLKNLQNESVKKSYTKDDVIIKQSTIKINMGEENTICFGNVKKRKMTDDNGHKKFKSYNIIVPAINDNCHKKHFSNDSSSKNPINNDNFNINDKTSSYQYSTLVSNEKNNDKPSNNEILSNSLSKTPVMYKTNNKLTLNETNIEIVDCTSVENETITNINEHLNYNKFGNEIVRKIPVKPLNKIKFNFSKT